ncbi:aminoglycoside phosphotransferase family protein [Ornithinibacillus sp. 179-J 7C1 HS]|uniref:aminoglycoside phosphotransferase family protein n=1 Tax=Ornithinibacillus sp. 179-J 7C1 HS TaxID=3142384 RepID=UPI0039A2653C
MDNNQVHAAWLYPDFDDRANKWIQTVIKESGDSIVGRIEDVKKTDLSLIKRIPTAEGDLYFKASNQSSAHEAILTKHISALSPENSVTTVAVHKTNGWLLMKDIDGESLRRLPNEKLWKRALQEYAELQVSQIQHVNELLSIGVPDRRMPTLKREIEENLEDMCATGLSAKETERVMALQPELLAMCDELDAIIPDSIEHGDLHSNNIRLVDNRIVFFDWGDATVSHPFFSTRIFWHALDELIDDQSKWLSMVEAFRPYYLKPWAEYVPMEQLVKASRISDELACVQRALSWHVYMTPHREKKEESFNRPAQWLRLLLEHRSLVGKM